LNEENVEIFEKKVLRIIFEAKREIGGLYRAYYNDELKALDKEPEITNFIRSQGLAWIGHVMRTSKDERVPKKCFVS
jgi:hypothetical protein